MTNNTTRIRQLNDAMRRGDKSVPGQFVTTEGIDVLLRSHKKTQNDIVIAVQQFDDFSADNDPYLEHDFGMFHFLAQKCFWKIDYYNHDMTAGSEDPSNPSKTMRVLTIMLAREY